MEARIPGSTEMARYSGTHRTQATDAKAQPAATSAMSSDEPRVDDGILTQRQPAESVRIDLEAAVSEMNEIAQAADRDIGFKLDDDSGRVVVSVTDRATGDVIRQIPSDEALELAAHLSDARSLLFKTEE